MKLSVLLVVLAAIGGMALGAVLFSRSEASATQPARIEGHQADVYPSLDDEASLNEIRLVCEDQTVRKFWIDLLHEKEFISDLFQSHLQRNYDCSKMLRIEKVDLNSDGRPEYLVQIRSILVCSPTSNCPFALYQIDDGEASQFRSSGGIKDFGLRRLLFTRAAMDLSFENTSTNGYRDLTRRFNNNPDGLYLERFKFDGREYQRERCFQERGVIKPSRCWDVDE